MGPWRRLSSRASELWIGGLVFGVAAIIGAIPVQPLLPVFDARWTRTPVAIVAPAGVISERLGVLPSSLTFHPSQLHHAGLIYAKRDRPGLQGCSAQLCVGRAGFSGRDFS
jgi:hypothetical protein